MYDIAPGSLHSAEDRDDVNIIQLKALHFMWFHMLFNNWKQYNYSEGEKIKGNPEISSDEYIWQREGLVSSFDLGNSCIKYGFDYGSYDWWHSVNVEEFRKLFFP